MFKFIETDIPYTIRFQYGDIGGDNPAQNLNLRVLLTQGNTTDRFRLGTSLGIDDLEEDEDYDDLIPFNDYEDGVATLNGLSAFPSILTYTVYGNVAGIEDRVLGHVVYKYPATINESGKVLSTSVWDYGGGGVDAQFDGYTHESLPSVDLDFSVKSRGAANQPEAVVDIKHGGQWVRLPITRVETRMNKDGPSDLAATSRVDVPVTWGRTVGAEQKVPIYEYIGESKTVDKQEAQFDVARVYYWNQYTEQYSVEQFGYVASIGPGDEDGTLRFYVYDAADLMTGISVSKTYDSPTAESVAKFAAFDEEFGVDENTPISVEAVSTTATGGADAETMDAETAGWRSESVSVLKFRKEQDAIIPFRSFLDGSLTTGGGKHFRRNRHTLADVMNWLTDEIGGIWYFEPTDTGVVLVVNNGAEEGEYNIARSAYYDGQFDPDGLEYIQSHNHAPIDVLNNSSLEDLKPINHLELNGESASSFLGVNAESPTVGGAVGAPKGHTNKYPHVEVTYPPLLERSGGTELGPPPIESGKQTLSEAKEEAVKKFKEEHEDNTDGSIEALALPAIRPYDYVAAVPVCNDTFDADMNPIQYEVNSVKHTASADKEYTTFLGVSMALIEDEIEVEGTYEEL